MPNDLSEDDDELLVELQAAGVAPPFEAEYFKKDGARVPFLIGAATVDGTSAECSATNAFVPQFCMVIYT